MRIIVVAEICYEPACEKAENQMKTRKNSGIRVDSQMKEIFSGEIELIFNCALIKDGIALTGCSIS